MSDSEAGSEDISENEVKIINLICSAIAFTAIVFEFHSFTNGNFRMWALPSYSGLVVQSLN